MSTTPDQTDQDPSDLVDIRIESLHLHPVKSCAAIDVNEALIVETGFDLDRLWMVVDPAGRLVTQRQLPRMALVQQKLGRGDEVVLRAPGMLALHLAADRVEEACTVQVWNDRVAAFDMGPLAAQWFSDFLGQPLRLARHDPDAHRLVPAAYRGEMQEETAFQDGFPLLVTSPASLVAMNRELAKDGAAPVDLRRFRPNIVIAGLDEHGEDHLHELTFDTPEGPVRLRLVEPCTRCPMPDVDPDTGEAGHAVGDALQRYRADPRMGGRVTFGMNAIVVEGIDRKLAVGMSGKASLAFG